MMFKKLILILTLVLSGCGLRASAKETHSIKNLKLNTQPSTPKQGEAVDSLKLDFDLVSSDGLDESRLRLLINEIAQSLNGSTVSFLNKVTDPDAGTESADVTIDSFNQVFNKVNNNLTLQYLISKDTIENPRAQKTLQNIFAIATDNVDSNGNSTATKIINLSIEDSLETESTSSTDRFIRIIARHDKRVIPEVSFDSFNAITNPITKNIKVKKIKNKVKTNVTKDFSFSLESESIPLADNLLQTVLKTNSFQVLEKQELLFKVNLKDFYVDTGLNLGTKVISFDKETIKFNSKSAVINGSSLNNELVFNTLSTKKNKNSLSSNDVVLTLDYKLSENGVSISQIDKLKFSLNQSGKKRNPKITANKNTKVNLINSGQISFDGDSNKIMIPIKLSFKSTSSKLEKKGFLNNSITKKIKIPMKIFARDSNGVEVILEGEEEIEVNMSFNLPSE